MDARTFQLATGATVSIAAKWAPLLSAAMAEFYISTQARIAAFLAQTGHESMGFTRARELWGPTPEQVRYEGRIDLGNTQVGDGARFKGRGLIQITGRKNYVAAGAALVLDLVGHPEILEEPDMAAISAAWWWAMHGLNQMADAGSFDMITRTINGGLTGKQDRDARWMKAKAVLGVAA